jgi:hypothetical protein
VVYLNGDIDEMIVSILEEKEEAYEMETPNCMTYKMHVRKNYINWRLLFRKQAEEKIAEHLEKFRTFYATNSSN